MNKLIKIFYLFSKPEKFDKNYFNFKFHQKNFPFGKLIYKNKTILILTQKELLLILKVAEIRKKLYGK
jgi:hypothetical protein